MNHRPQIIEAAKAADGPLTMSQIVSALGVSEARRQEVVDEVVLMVKHWELVKKDAPPGSGSGTRSVYSLPRRTV